MPEPADRLPNAAGHEAFLHRKIEAARQSVVTGNGLSNDEIEAEFAALRATKRVPKS